MSWRVTPQGTVHWRQRRHDLDLPRRARSAEDNVGKHRAWGGVRERQIAVFVAGDAEVEDEHQQQGQSSEFDWHIRLMSASESADFRSYYFP